VIESVSFTGGPSVTIKSHHNVGGLPDRMNMTVKTVGVMECVLSGEGSPAIRGRFTATSTQTVTSSA
jgi:hypothetical protein